MRLEGRGDEEVKSEIGSGVSFLPPGMPCEVNYLTNYDLGSLMVCGREEIDWTGPHKAVDVDLHPPLAWHAVIRHSTAGSDLSFLSILSFSLGVCIHLATNVLTTSLQLDVFAFSTSADSRRKRFLSSFSPFFLKFYIAPWFHNRRCAQTHCHNLHLPPNERPRRPRTPSHGGPLELPRLPVRRVAHQQRGAQPLRALGRLRGRARQHLPRRRRAADRVAGL